MTSSNVFLFMNDYLRERVREAIASGRLPAQKPLRSWAGKGSGTPCSICLHTLTADDIELEVEFAEDSSSRQARCCRFHSACFEAWEQERGRGY